MKNLAERYKDKPVLVIGHDHCIQVAQHYGFNRPLTTESLYQWNPSMIPFKTPNKSGLNPLFDFHQEKIHAILVFHDSWDWGRDLQIAMDILVSDQGQLGTEINPLKQSVPVYFSNGDLIWSNDYPTVRFAQGAFNSCLKHLFKQRTGHDLVYTQFGKPERVQYDFAWSRLKEHGDIHQVYMIGDNPASDIKVYGLI